MHKSADLNHYDRSAKNYDLFNERDSATINKTIEDLLKKYGIRTVLDLTCGTGSQVFWLHQRGFDVVGYDINHKMLSVAREKAQQAQLDIEFHHGDMRTTRAGQFDAVITIFNAIGHLTKADFKIAIRNVHANLKHDGLCVFDIFNLDYLLNGENITQLTIDWVCKASGKEVREIQYSTVDREGILASYNVCSKDHRIISSQTLQVYNRAQLTDMLNDCGFDVLCCCGIDGGEFCNLTTQRMLIVAQKQTI